ncbi:hypothetical protein [Amycolatopsis sp. PS_44_ISF1]|uniref:hypothetical protein n=1 Tax=Amycolatopsis sp. PS_44_ISF1 TaxID=2974917 RepID=UPI0028DF5F7B|nr:hypothetical protein [Amycolatopsis sp. PS_44_ISF1]MDT8912885.1 hypothetical protein [Amycolatopsis sp. PS_44_ISF1]
MTTTIEGAGAALASFPQDSGLPGMIRGCGEAFFGAKFADVPPHPGGRGAGR